MYPFPDHRPAGHVEHFCGLRNAQPAEEAQLDDVRLPRVELGEGIQRVIERNEIRILFRRTQDLLVQLARNCVASAPLRTPENDDLSDLSEKILLLDKFNAGVYFSRGAARARKGDIVAAIRDFDKVLTFNPGNSWALGNRGYLRQKTGDTAGAMQDYSSAIRINVRNFIAFNNRGILRYDLKDLNGAVTDYTRAIAINPRQAVVFNNRGRAYKDLGLYAKARDDFDTAIALNSALSQTYLNRAHLNVLENRNDEAAKDIENYRAHAGDENDTLVQVVREALDRGIKSPLDRSPQSR